MEAAWEWRRMKDPAQSKRSSGMGVRGIEAVAPGMACYTACGNGFGKVMTGGAPGAVSLEHVEAGCSDMHAEHSCKLSCHRSGLSSLSRTCM